MFQPDSITPSTVIIYPTPTPSEDTALLNARSVKNLTSSVNEPKTGCVISSCCLVIGCLAIIGLVVAVFFNAAGWSDQSWERKKVVLGLSISASIVAGLCCGLGLIGLRSLDDQDSHKVFIGTAMAIP